MPNPSIVAEDLHAQREAFLADYNNLSLSKANREQALRILRQIEAELDLPEAERTPPHNRGGKHEPAPPTVITINQLRAAREGLDTLTLYEIGVVLSALQATGNTDVLAKLTK